MRPSVRYHLCYRTLIPAFSPEYGGEGAGLRPPRSPSARSAIAHEDVGGPRASLSGRPAFRAIVVQQYSCGGSMVARAAGIVFILLSSYMTITPSYAADTPRPGEFGRAESVAKNGMVATTHPQAVHIGV